MIRLFSRKGLEIDASAPGLVVARTLDESEVRARYGPGLPEAEGVDSFIARVSKIDPTLAYAFTSKSRVRIDEMDPKRFVVTATGVEWRAAEEDVPLGPSIQYLDLDELEPEEMQAFFGSLVG